MKKYLLLALLITFLSGFCLKSHKTTVFIAGDSTAQTYTQERHGYIRGWGQMLPLYLTDDVQVINHAMGGRSTKSFIAEGRWEKLLAQVQKGDYVFIQFGHNDASKKPERHASYEDYRANLVRMVNDVRQRKGHPVLLTSIVMRTFYKGNLIDDRLKGYPVIMRQVAKEMNVPLIDANLKTRDFVTMLGDKASIPYYRHVEPGVDHIKPDGVKDDTHMMEKGARKVAYLIAEGIREAQLKGLSKYISLENVPE